MGAGRDHIASRRWKAVRTENIRDDIRAIFSVFAKVVSDHFIGVILNDIIH